MNEQCYQDAAHINNNNINNNLPTYVQIAILMIQMLNPGADVQSILKEKLADIPAQLLCAEQVIGHIKCYDEKFYETDKNFTNLIKNFTIPTKSMRHLYKILRYR